MCSQTAACASRMAILIVLSCWVPAIAQGARPGPTRLAEIPVILETHIHGDCDAAAVAASPRASDGKGTAAREYSMCKSWQEVVEGENLRYAPVIRVSDPATKDRPAYTGFWFYDGLQFDKSGRYALAMKVHFHERDVTQSDRGEIGYID